MAYLDNLMAIEQPWAAAYCPALADSWSISDILTKETDTIANALHNSFAASFSGGDGVLPAKPASLTLTTTMVSGGSENEAAASKSRRIGTQGGRVTKRKSRASKKTVTTFITADPSNFRQMVQQITGVDFAGQMSAAPLLKPEPQRDGIGRIQAGDSFLPIDPSTFFVDGSAPSPPEAAVESDRGGDVGGMVGNDFDSFCSFPTLESWKVM